MQRDNNTAFCLDVIMLCRLYLGKLVWAFDCHGNIRFMWNVISFYTIWFIIWIYFVLCISLIVYFLIKFSFNWLHMYMLALKFLWFNFIYRHTATLSISYWSNLRISVEKYKHCGFTKSSMPFLYIIKVLMYHNIIRSCWYDFSIVNANKFL